MAMPNQYDPLTMMRLGNMFKPSPFNPNNGVIDQNAMASVPNNIRTPMQDPSQSQMNPNDRMNQLYHPSYEASNNYMNVLGQMPQREPISGWRKTAAVLAGLGTGGPTGHWGGQPVGYQGNPSGAMGVSNAIASLPYNEKMQDWGTKVNALGTASQLENQRNRGELTAAENVIRNEMTGRARDISEERNKLAADREKNSNEIAWAKYQRDYDVALQKLDDAQKKMAIDAENKKNQFDLATAKFEAQKAQAELEHARKMSDLERLQKQTEAQIKNWEESQNLNRDKFKQSQQPTTKERKFSFNQQGQPVGYTDTTSKGNNAPLTVRMTGPDGVDYDVPQDKVEEAKSKHGMKVKGGS